VKDPERTFTRSCAHVIEAMQSDAADDRALICVVIATKREVLEIDASTVMVGPDHAPDILVDFACRIRPAIEELAREVARERGRLDLEQELAARRASVLGPDGQYVSRDEERAS